MSYRCIHAACARELPRAVNFCPYCGTGQHEGVDKPQRGLFAGSADAAMAGSSDAAPQKHEVMQHSVAPARARGAADFPDAQKRDAVRAGTSMAALSLQAGGERASATGPRVGSEPAAVFRTQAGAAPGGAALGAQSAAASNAASGAQAAAPASAPAAQAVAPPASAPGATAAAPSVSAPGAQAAAPFASASVATVAPPSASVFGRRPAADPKSAAKSPAKRKGTFLTLRLRDWVLVALIGSVVWTIAKPDPSKKLDKRIDAVIVLTADCKFDDARKELEALRSAQATPEQLNKLQNAIDTAIPVCEKQRLHAKSARHTGITRDSAPHAASAPVRKPAHSGPAAPPPQAKPTPAAATPTAAKSAAAKPTSADADAPARAILSDARHEIALGNYKAAVDKMDLCITMIDAANKECMAVKLKAQRLQQDMLRCVGAGNEWIGDRCQ